MIKKIFKRREKRFFTGEIIKDYGEISEDRFSRSDIRYNAYLTEKDNIRYFIIKRFIKYPTGRSVEYIRFNRTNLEKLKQSVDDAINQI